MELAVQGITSFSTLPLKVWTYFGSFIAFISFLYGLKIIIEKLFFGINASGYASLMVAILFFGGVQLIGIGFRRIFRKNILRKQTQTTLYYKT
ncbi:hypothetical protein QW060_27290 [Myroides ceti]|uniref:Uncharacterized protein n=1 Tax=Paenimyroides ceti TaxID=395087 RepID=A0ABT8D0X4_9FLAO|nr:hypothetical protein [Paenimyroides ceti]MDN3710503.1 hypothetical protein [Paenimyroides ceti]